MPIRAQKPPDNCEENGRSLKICMFEICIFISELCASKYTYEDFMVNYVC